MLNRILFVLLLSLSMMSDALAEIKRVAVLEFRGVGIQSAYLLKLSDQSRRAALDVLPEEQYLIMTRENMLLILADMGLDVSCLKGECEVEVGRNINADLVIAGDIMKIESTYVLTLKLYDTYSGRLLSTLDVEETDLLDMKREAYRQSQQLIRSGLGFEMPKDTSPKNKVNRVQKVQQSGATLEGNGYQAKLIPAGTFTMGCTGSSHCEYDEFPTHEVRISRDFYMMESEVTQALYTEVMTTNPSLFFGRQHPVESVTWLNATQFANRLSQMEGLEPCYKINRGRVEWTDISCTGWRLPTEAEWEYAARGPEARRYPWGAEPACGMRADVGKDLWGDGMTRGPCLHDDVPSMADARGESPFAVMAMAGGMLEWTSGGYATPDGLMPGFHVARGGSWTDEDPTRLRASARVPLPDTHQAIDVGVRCVFDDPD